MDDLEKLRGEIDEIDRELVMNFERRMEIILKIAAYKDEKGLPILDKSREEYIIKKNLSNIKNKNLEPPLREFLIEIMNISKNFMKNIKLL